MAAVRVEYEWKQEAGGGGVVCSAQVAACTLQLSRPAESVQSASLVSPPLLQCRPLVISLALPLEMTSTVLASPPSSSPLSPPARSSQPAAGLPTAAPVRFTYQPCWSELQLDVRWDGLRAEATLDDALMAAAVLVLTAAAMTAQPTSRRKQRVAAPSAGSPKAAVSSSDLAAAPWLLSLLRVPRRVHVRLSALSVLLKPAVFSSATASSFPLACMDPCQLSLESLQWKLQRSTPRQPLTAAFPASFPLRCTFNVVSLLWTAHLPLASPLIAVAPASPSQPNPSSSSLPAAAGAHVTSPFHLVDLSSLDAELELDVSSILRARPPQQGSKVETTQQQQRARRHSRARAAVIDENRCSITVGSSHLRAHPVLSSWANLMLSLLPSPAASSSSAAEAAASAGSSSSRPVSSPFVSFHSPLKLPSLPLRFSFSLPGLSCSVHHIDRTPLLQLRLSGLQLSASSSRFASRYDAGLLLDAIGLYAYDSSSSDHHFDDAEAGDAQHERRACLLGAEQLSLPLSIVNVGEDDDPASTSHLLLALSCRLHSLRVKYVAAAVAHLPLLHSTYLAAHPALHRIVLHRLRLRSLAAASRAPAKPSQQQQRPASPSSSSSSSSIPLLVELSVTLRLLHVLVPAEAEDGFHALALQLQSISLQHEFDSSQPLNPFLRGGGSSSLTVLSSLVLLHHPYCSAQSARDRQLLQSLGVQHGAVQEVGEAGRLELCCLSRSEHQVVDSVVVKVASLGLGWSFFLQMSLWQLRHSLQDDLAAMRAVAALFPSASLSASSPAAPLPASASSESRSERPYIVIVSVHMFALELAFTEWTSSGSGGSASSSSASPLSPSTSSMLFFSHRLDFSHPAAFPFPETPNTPPSPYPLPLSVAAGYWSVNSVPMLVWQQARLGGGRGASGLPDACGEMRGGQFRLPSAFQFGRDIQLMIDRWKAFKCWRKARREARRAAGREAEGEQERHRRQLPHFPYAVDFDLGCIWLRLLDCSFALCDEPQQVAALEQRRAKLSSTQAKREAELRALAGWRQSFQLSEREITEASVSGSVSMRSSRPPSIRGIPQDRKRRKSVSHIAALDESERSARSRGAAAADNGGSGRMSKSQSLNFEEDKKLRAAASQQQAAAAAAGWHASGSSSSRQLNGGTAVTDASQCCALVQAMLERAWRLVVLPFPPASAFPFSAPLFSIVSPDVAFTVSYSPQLLDMSQLYRLTRALDPDAAPPYAAFIDAEDAARRAGGAEGKRSPDAAALRVENSFIELWGRHLQLTGQRVEMCWRDFPLPLLKAKSLHLAGTVIIGQLQAPERWLFTQTTCLAPAALLSSSSSTPAPLSLSFLRGASIPTKLYYDMRWTGSEVDATHGLCYSGAHSAMAEAFNRLTPPALPRVGGPLPWWDDLRYKVHGRLRIAALDELNVRIMKTDSPYRKAFLLLSGSTVELLHTSSVFDGWGHDVGFTVISDEHEGQHEGGGGRQPDYVQGQLLSVPHARVRVELLWRCCPLPDGREPHWFEHHLHHCSWNGPQQDVMDFYRARRLQYRVEVALQPKQLRALLSSSRHPHHSHQRSPASPLSPSESPHRTAPSSFPSSSTPPQSARPSSASLLPSLTLRWSAYTWFWHLIAMFQDPPLFLSPMERRSSPSLGELFSCLSLSVLCQQPRVELLYEDETAPGRLNALQLCAERFGIDWMWMAHWDDQGRKSFESQDMACDALYLQARAMLPSQYSRGGLGSAAQEDKQSEDAAHQQQQGRTRSRASAQPARDAKARQLLSAALHQQQKREEGEIVNFNDAAGVYCSPFEHQPVDYHSEYFLAARVFAYRTHYQPPVPAFSPSASAAASPLHRKDSSSSLPQRSASTLGAGAPERPPFDMPQQGVWDGSEWTALFGEFMPGNDSADSLDAVWEGRSWQEEAGRLSPSSQHSESDAQFPYASVNDASAAGEQEGRGEEEEELYLRRHTLSLSGLSDDGDGDDEAAAARLLPMLDEHYVPPHRRTAAGQQRPHSDGNVTYASYLPQPAPTVRPPARSPTPSGLLSSSLSGPLSAFPNISVGATRGRSPPAQAPRDLSSCSHRFIGINLKLLWSTQILRSLQQWMQVITRPYEPPAFVKQSQADTAAWRLAKETEALQREKKTQDEQLHRCEEKEGQDSELQVVLEEAEEAEVVAVFDLTHSAAASPHLALGSTAEFERASPIPAAHLSPLNGSDSSDSDAEQAAQEMLALVRGAEEADEEPLSSPQASQQPSPPPSVPPSRRSSLDGSGPASTFPFSSLRSPSSLRSVLRQYEGRRADTDSWLSLFGFDLVRPQVSFQSRDTNSRLVLVAARARVDSEGLPIHVHRQQRGGQDGAAHSELSS